MKSFFCEHSIFDKYLRAPAYLSHDKASAVEKRIGKSMLTIFIFMYRLNQILNKKAIWWNFRILPSFMLWFFSIFNVCIFLWHMGSFQSQDAVMSLQELEKINPCQTKTSKLLITTLFFKGGRTMSKWLTTCQFLSVFISTLVLHSELKTTVWRGG